MDLFGLFRECPDCSEPLAADAETCAACGLPLTGDEAGRLGVVLSRLERLERQAEQARANRDELLTHLRAARDQRGHQRGPAASEQDPANGANAASLAENAARPNETGADSPHETDNAAGAPNAAHAATAVTSADDSPAAPHSHTDGPTVTEPALGTGHHSPTAPPPLTDGSPTDDTAGATPATPGTGEPASDNAAGAPPAPGEPAVGHAAAAASPAPPHHPAEPAANAFPAAPSGHAHDPHSGADRPSPEAPAAASSAASRHHGDGPYDAPSSHDGLPVSIGADLTSGARAAPSPGTAVPHAPSRARRPRIRRRPRREISARLVQNILLVLGGVLLSIAAAVFTVVTWGDLGIGGKSAVLAGITGLTGYAARPLHRRGMRATAETFGGLTAVMLGLDAFALWGVQGAELNPFGYTAGAGAVVAALLTGYSRLVPLRGPRVLAVLTAQVVAPFTAIGLDLPWAALATALAVTAFGDAALHRVLAGGRLRRVVRGLAATAWTAAVVPAAGLTVAAAVASMGGDLWSPGVWPALAFAAAGVTGAFALLRDSGVPDRARSVVAGGATAAWTGVLPAAVAGVAGSAAWAMAGLTLSAAVAAAMTTTGPQLGRAHGRGPTIAVRSVLVLATVCSAPALFAPLDRLRRVFGPWQEFTPNVLPDSWPLAVLCGTALTGIGWTLAARDARREWTAPAALTTATLTVVAGTGALPDAAGLPVLVGTAVVLSALAAAESSRPLATLVAVVGAGRAHTEHAPGEGPTGAADVAARPHSGAGRRPLLRGRVPGIRGLGGDGRAASRLTTDSDAEDAPGGFGSSTTPLAPNADSASTANRTTSTNTASNDRAALRPPTGSDAEGASGDPGNSSTTPLAPNADSASTANRTTSTSSATEDRAASRLTTGSEGGEATADPTPDPVGPAGESATAANRAGAAKPAVGAGAALAASGGVAALRLTAMTALVLAGAVGVVAVAGSLVGPVSTVGTLSVFTVAAVVAALPRSGRVVEAAHAGAAVVAATLTATAMGAATNERLTALASASLGARTAADAPAAAFVAAYLGIGVAVAITATVLERRGLRAHQVRALDAALPLPLAAAGISSAVIGWDATAATVAAAGLPLLTVLTHQQSVWPAGRSGARAASAVAFAASALLATPMLVPLLNQLRLLQSWPWIAGTTLTQRIADVPQPSAVLTVALLLVVGGAVGWTALTYREATNRVALAGGSLAVLLGAVWLPLTAMVAVQAALAATLLLVASLAGRVALTGHDAAPNRSPAGHDDRAVSASASTTPLLLALASLANRDVAAVADAAPRPDRASADPSAAPPAGQPDGAADPRHEAQRDSQRDALRLLLTTWAGRIDAHSAAPAGAPAPAPPPAGARDGRAPVAAPENARPAVRDRLLTRGAGGPLGLLAGLLRPAHQLSNLALGIAVGVGLLALTTVLAGPGLMLVTFAGLAAAAMALAAPRSTAPVQAVAAGGAVLVTTADMWSLLAWDAEEAWVATSGLLPIGALAIAVATRLDRAGTRTAQVRALHVAAVLPLALTLVAGLSQDADFGGLTAAVLVLVLLTAATHRRSLPDAARKAWAVGAVLLGAGAVIGVAPLLGRVTVDHLRWVAHPWQPEGVAAPAPLLPVAPSVAEATDTATIGILVAAAVLALGSRVRANALPAALGGILLMAVVATTWLTDTAVPAALTAIAVAALAVAVTGDTIAHRRRGGSGLPRRAQAAGAANDRGAATSPAHGWSHHGDGPDAGDASSGAGSDAPGVANLSNRVGTGGPEADKTDQVSSGTRHDGPPRGGGRVGRHDGPDVDGLPRTAGRDGPSPAAEPRDWHGRHAPDGGPANVAGRPGAEPSGSRRPSLVRLVVGPAADPVQVAGRVVLVGLVAAGVTAPLAVASALVTSTTTVAVLAALTAAAGVAAVAGTGPAVRVAASAGAVVCLSGLTTAGFLAASASRIALGLALLAVATGAIGTATALSRARVRGEQVVSLDIAAALPIATAVAFTIGAGRDLTSLVVALSALLTLVAATHPAALAVAGGGQGWRGLVVLRHAAPGSPRFAVRPGSDGRMAARAGEASAEPSEDDRPPFSGRTGARQPDPDTPAAQAGPEPATGHVGPGDDPAAARAAGQEDLGRHGDGWAQAPAARAVSGGPGIGGRGAPDRSDTDRRAPADPAGRGAAVPAAAGSAFAASREPAGVVAAAFTESRGLAAFARAAWGLVGLSVSLAVVALALLAPEIAATFLRPLGDATQVVVAHPFRTAPTSTLLEWQRTDAPTLVLSACAIALTTLALAAAVGWGRGAVASAGAVAAGLFAPLLVSHLPVPYDAALAVLVATAGGLLLRTATARGAAAHPQFAVGALLAVMAAGWSLTLPERAVLVFAALSGLAILALARVRPHTRTTVPFAVRALAFLAAFGTGVTAVIIHEALPFEGPVADPRLDPFIGLAMAAATAVTSRIPRAAPHPEQRGGLVAAGLALTALSPLLGEPGDLLPLEVAVGALLLLAFAASVEGLLRRAITTAGVLAMLGALSAVVGTLLEVLIAPYTWLTAVWDGAGAVHLRAPAAEVLTPWSGVTPDPTLLPVVTLTALGLLVVVRTHARSWLAPATALLAVPVLAPYPVGTALPYGAALAWLLAVAAALAVVAALALRPRTAVAAGAAALWLASLALAWGLTDRSETLVVLASLAAIAAVATALGRTVTFAAGAIATATLLTGVFALTLPLALGQPAEVAALAPIVVVAGVAAAGGLPRLHPRVFAAAEAATGVLAVVSVALTLAGDTRLELTSAALACLGAIALASAPRGNRRWLGVLGAVLLLSALWVFLGWVRVTAPEPYTTLPALLALAAGWEWRRRRPGTGTWLAYGGGLALLLLPGLVMAYFGAEQHTWRLGLLAVTALALTLIGAWRRLQAPLLVGAGVLPLLAAAPSAGAPAPERESGPAAESGADGPVWLDLLAWLPDWVPFAAAGVLLIAIGARYEQRLRDLRRIGRALKDME